MLRLVLQLGISQEALLYLCSPTSGPAAGGSSVEEEAEVQEELLGKVGEGGNGHVYISITSILPASHVHVCCVRVYVTSAYDTCMLETCMQCQSSTHPSIIDDAQAMEAVCHHM